MVAGKPSSWQKICLESNKSMDSEGDDIQYRLAMLIIIYAGRHVSLLCNGMMVHQLSLHVST